MFNVRTMSAPLSRKNLPENPTPDDILNAFLVAAAAFVFRPEPESLKLQETEIITIFLL